MSKEGGAPKEQVRSRWPWRPVGLPARSLRASAARARAPPPIGGATLNATPNARAPQLRPKDVFNPKLQRAYQCIQHRALQKPGDSNALPVPSTRIQQPFQPSAELFDQARGALEAFRAACPLAPSSAGGRKRGVWGGGSGDAKRGKPDDGPVVGAGSVGLQLKATSVEQVCLLLPVCF